MKNYNDRQILSIKIAFSIQLQSIQMTINIMLTPNAVLFLVAKIVRSIYGQKYVVRLFYNVFVCVYLLVVIDLEKEEEGGGKPIKFFEKKITF